MPGVETGDARWRADAFAEGSDVFGEAALRGAATALAAGGILIHPTSTVYGLGARPRPSLDGAIARLKRRPPAPLIRLAADETALRAALPALEWSEPARRLAAALWPGPLTLVMAHRGTSLAVRVDAHPMIRAVLGLAGGLMTSTSMNPSGAEPARTRAEVLETLGRLATPPKPGWLDAGDLEPSPSSTIVDVRGDVARTIRRGAVSDDTIMRVLENEVGGSP